MRPSWQTTSTPAEDFWSTLPLMYTAEAYLRIVETGSEGAERARAIASAKSACARATQHGRRIADGSAADALRLCGVHAWLTGRTQLAEQRWRRGLALAAALNAKHAVARLHHELGTRSDLPAHRRSAETLFAEMRVPEARAST